MNTAGSCNFIELHSGSSCTVTVIFDVDVNGTTIHHTKDVNIKSREDGTVLIVWQ